MIDILIGTKNEYKATEMAWFVRNLSGVEIHFWEEAGISIKVEENQPSLKQNAEKKAVEISRLTDWYVLASDGGVDIPGLGSKWDVLRNQRIVGENKTDLQKADTLLKLMQGLKGKKRRAIYRLALALAKNGRLIWSTEQVSDQGYITEKLANRNIPRYRWMGHLWYYPEFDKVFNELTEKEKNKVRQQGLEIQKSLVGAVQILEQSD